jgi:hypothetical protein
MPVGTKLCACGCKRPIPLERLRKRSTYFNRAHRKHAKHLREYKVRKEAFKALRTNRAQWLQERKK